MSSLMPAAMPITSTTQGRTLVNGLELAWQSFARSEGGPDSAAQTVAVAPPLVLLHGGFGSVEMFGANAAALAGGRRVLGIDLQSHGRSPAAAGRPMRFQDMADDVAALIAHPDLAVHGGRVDVLGFSLGGGVALRLAIQHPEVVRRLVLVSAPYRRAGWHPEMTAGMDAMGPEFAEPLRQTPMFAVYQALAPNVDDWPVLVTQVTTLLKDDYDWSAEAAGLVPATMIVAGDADGLAPRSAVEFFELLGGGLRDASWDRSGMTRHRLAILPGSTHYDINLSPLLAQVTAAFLDEPDS